jgi:DNA-binding transcriptional MerR regulator
MNPPFYSQSAFATLAGVSLHTVAYWIRIGAVGSVKLGKTRQVYWAGGEP